VRRMVLPAALFIDGVGKLCEEIDRFDVKEPLEIDFHDLRHFDSAAAAFFHHLKNNRPAIAFVNLRPDIERVLALFPPARQKENTASRSLSWVEKWRLLKTQKDKFKQSFANFFTLLADEIFHTMRYLVKRQGVYPGEIMHQLYYMGYNSFPIVSVISFLVGITISITTAEQLRNFGADIYLADIVGFGMVRELVPLMTGIILAGKIGASITAEISSMKVLEEIDALKTMGLIPEKFLMVPRLIAISLAIPLLLTLADVIGILGGVLVSYFVSGIEPGTFFSEMFAVVKLSDFFIGLLKTLVFGWIVVISSGYKGFFVGRGAVGVGIATTESVVLSISLIILTDCAFALVLY